MRPSFSIEGDLGKDTRCEWTDPLPILSHSTTTQCLSNHINQRAYNNSIKNVPRHSFLILSCCSVPAGRNTSLKCGSGSGGPQNRGNAMPCLFFFVLRSLLVTSSFKLLIILLLPLVTYILLSQSVLFADVLYSLCLITLLAIILIINQGIYNTRINQGFTFTTLE